MEGSSDCSLQIHVSSCRLNVRGGGRTWGLASGLAVMSASEIFLSGQSRGQVWNESKGNTVQFFTHSEIKISLKIVLELTKKKKALMGTSWGPGRPLACSHTVSTDSSRVCASPDCFSFYTFAVLRNLNYSSRFSFGMGLPLKNTSSLLCLYSIIFTFLIIIGLASTACQRLLVLLT